MQTDEYARLFEHEDSYWWYVGRRRLAIDLLRRFSNFAAPQIIDLGCGTGAVLSDLSPIDNTPHSTKRAIEQKGLDLKSQSRLPGAACSSAAAPIGIDASRLALKFCKQRNLSLLIQGDAAQLPIQSSVAQAVIALDIFEHVKDDRAAVREVARILSSGGILVLSVPAFQWLWGPHDVSLMHFRRYRAKEIETLLNESGLVVEKVSYGVFILFPAVVAVRMFERMKRGDPRVSLPSVPPWLNRFLIWIQRVESKWIARIRLPWGSSVVAVARKP